MKKNSTIKNKTSIFMFINFGSKRKKEMLYSPTEKQDWIMHMFSEFMGTLLISMAFIGLATIMHNGHAVVEYMYNKLVVVAYAVLVPIILLAIFLRWSCDINPSVTVYRMIHGTNSVKYGLLKILFQFLGGIVAGCFLWWFTTNPVHSAIDATKNIGLFTLGWLSNGTHKLSLAGGFFWELFAETIMTMVLLWGVFSRGISDKYRDITIAFGIGCALGVGFISGESLAMNPARGIAQQVPAIFTGTANGGIWITSLALLLTGITSPFLYAILQGIVEEWITPMLSIVIAFKNKNMQLEQNNKNVDIEIISKKNKKLGKK